MARDGGHVHRGGQIIDDAVEQALHADVFEGRAAEDRMQLEGDGGRAEGLANFVFGGFLAGEIFFHEMVVGLGGLFDQVVAPLFVAFLFIFGEWAFR